MTPFDRDAAAADALLSDLYLDAILARRTLLGEGASQDLPNGLDPAIRAASDRLRHDLVRVHPSFRFEERLAMRLAEAAVQMRIPAAVGGDGRVVPFRVPGRMRGRRSASEPAVSGGPTEVGGLPGDPLALDRRDRARPLLIGGALTSAALSLAGAAIVAWRWTRPGSPMSRAARAVRDARNAATTTARLPQSARRLH